MLLLAALKNQMFLCDHNENNIHIYKENNNIIRNTNRNRNKTNVNELISAGKKRKYCLHNAVVGRSLLLKRMQKIQKFPSFFKTIACIHTRVCIKIITEGLLAYGLYIIFFTYIR